MQTNYKIHSLPAGMFYDGELNILISTHHGVNICQMWTRGVLGDRIVWKLDGVEHQAATLDCARTAIDKALGTDEGAPNQRREWWREGVAAQPGALNGSTPAWR